MQNNQSETLPRAHITKLDLSPQARSSYLQSSRILVQDYRSKEESEPRGQQASCCPHDTHKVLVFRKGAATITRMLLWELHFSYACSSQSNKLHGLEASMPLNHATQHGSHILASHAEVSTFAVFSPSLLSWQMLTAECLPPRRCR